MNEEKKTKKGEGQTDGKIVAIVILIILVVGLGVALIAVIIPERDFYETRYGISKEADVPETGTPGDIIEGITREGIETSRILVGMIPGFGSIDDKTFNATIWKGVADAQGINIVQGSFIPAALEEDLPQLKKNVEKLSTSGYKVVVLNGFTFGDDFDTPEPDGIALDAAKRYKDVNYVLVDGTDPDATPDNPRGEPNLRGLTFREDQAGYLSCYAGAWAIYYQPGPQGGGEGNIGTFGGLPIPAVTKFMEGCQFGLERFNKDVPGSTVGLVGYNAADSSGEFVCDFSPDNPNCENPFNNPDVGAEITRRHIQNDNVKIEFPVAGGTGLGAFDVAKELPKSDLHYIIGVDNSWAPLAADFGVDSTRVLTSALKRMDRAVTDQVQGVEQGTFFNSFDYVGKLANSGVGYAPVSSTVVNSSELTTKLESLINQIILGEGVLP